MVFLPYLKRSIQHITTEKYPYLVCEKDNLVVGYAYAGVAFSEKDDEYLSHNSYLFHMKEGYEKGVNPDLGR